MRITMRLVGAIIAGVLLLVPLTVKAHHAFAAAFDENKPINLQGTVTKVELSILTRGSGWTSKIQTARLLIGESGAACRPMSSGRESRSQLYRKKRRLNFSHIRPRAERASASGCLWSTLTVEKFSWAALPPAPMGKNRLQ